MSKTLYTANIGGYDSLQEPETITPGWNYICYSDRPIQSKTWDVRIVAPIYGPVKTARAIKILHRQYVPDGTSVWMDASMTPCGDLNEFLMRYHYGTFVIPAHPERTCLYEEAKVCKQIGKDIPGIIDEQTHGYRLDGFPAGAGLVASGIIIRSADHNSFSRAWWNEVFRKSCRDQISFPYVAKHHDLDYMVMPFDEVTSEFFRWKSLHPVS